MWYRYTLAFFPRLPFFIPFSLKAHIPDVSTRHPGLVRLLVVPVWLVSSRLALPVITVAPHSPHSPGSSHRHVHFPIQQKIPHVGLASISTGARVDRTSCL
ncbi:hypothetical protein B0H19DRAFT_378107 [Mycena capillaripes]|nr:hypothetical protein B0H19DRAFT_378107 [Mycena capillaripes]